MIFPIPKKTVYSEGTYTVCKTFTTMSLVELFSAVKEGETEISLCHSESLASEEYKISISEGGIALSYSSEEGLFRAVTSLYQLLQSRGEVLPLCEIEDAPMLSRRGYMLDISRGRMPKVETFKKIIDYLAILKYNELQIYMEGHVFKFPSFPKYTEEFDCLNAENLKEIQRYCKERFIDLVPNQNSFGHMYQWLKKPELSHLAVAPEGGKGGTINPLLPESYELIDRIYSDLLPLHESEYVNVGFDEAGGLGKYQLEEVCKKYGKDNVFMDWLNKVADLCRNKYGKKVQFWSDMINSYPEAFRRIPEGAVVLEWGYEYKSMPRMAANCAEYQRKGLEFYLCPSCNTHLAFTGRNETTLFNIRSSAEIAKQSGAKGLLLTDWGCDCGQPTFLVWSAFPIAFAAQCAWNVKNGRGIVRDTERYVDRLIFGGKNVSELLRRISNYYLYEPDQIDCGTICGQSLQIGLNEMSFRGIFDLRTRPYPVYFDNVIRHVKESLAELEGVEINPFYKRQITLNARMVMFSAALCKLRLGEKPDADGIRALIAEADAIEKEFLLLWNAENYEHGSDEFLSQLRGRREDLLALLAS